MSDPGSTADRTAASARWMLARRVTANVARIAAVAVLARHLSPAEFGVVALAQVVLQFVTLVGEAGIGTYVIYDAADGREERARAAFWLNVGLTAAQCVICLAALPLVRALFPGTEVVPLLAALLAVFFVRQLATVPEALVQRDLRHPVLARRDMAFDLGSAGFSIVLAVAGAGAWSLVIPSLLLEPVRLGVTLRAARWAPGARLGTGHWRPILRYVAPLMGTNVLVPVTNDGDTLLVGRLLGTATVGYYNVAWQLANLAGRNISAVVVNVALPALALLRGDEERLRAGYVRTVRFLGFTCLPALVVMGALAPDLVSVLYGPRWGPAVTLLRIFVAFTVVRSLTSSASMVYNVTGRPGIGFRVVAWLTPAYVAAILVGSRWGAGGIATGVVLTRTVAALVDTALAARQIRLPLGRLGAALAAPAALSGVTGAVAWGAVQALGHAGFGPLPRMVAATAVAVVAFGSLVVTFRPAGHDDLRRAVRVGIPRRRPAADPADPAAPAESGAAAPADPAAPAESGAAAPAESGAAVAVGEPA